MNVPKRVLVAIGGNSVIKDKTRTSISDQYACIVETAEQIVEMVVKENISVAVTHGNGPQVGFSMTRSEQGAKQGAPELPLDVIDAQTEGQLGYQLQQALHNSMIRRGLDGNVVSLITQVEVNPNDPAFTSPTKPVGSFYSEGEAQILQEQNGWVMKEQTHGWRRVVASPTPLRIVEEWAIENIMNNNGIAICLGGGGIPVVRNLESQVLRGVPAVIDKDAVSALLAERLGFDSIIFSTGVSNIFANFNTETQTALKNISVDQARTLLSDGEFPAGSMGPKVQAALDFVTGALSQQSTDKGCVKNCAGRRAIVTDPLHLVEAMYCSDSKYGSIIS
mmetsp:Transcript_5316/g.8201  ORF Transcript_5316/g.8201 Transcript_5316/m.8201 type:complete len:335 (+) Transcript_5316:466-1470(+)|eukprot:CAMPEP_0203747878 /NCGR_PEP_ID=MMETSP0098-20131031/2903_1 /ASSEMBLY_ACC=CAM_ASM_000208 /TAXON_ID=96639 /ORGANISM=" , Strain NY0313808BC1" /LENGTH=334 /DNA_ID=CAMNT_0050636445 /DNA_START=312 /DNA_END=1316 /DNA_ORIENTATION=+